MKTVAIVQARMGSSRLPGKVLADLAGEPMLARVVARLSRARTLDDIWIATTTERQDDVLAALCRERGWSFIRGSEQDVLDRYYRAAQESGATHVVRVTSDCPLIDPDVVDRVVTALREADGRVVYSSNVSPIRTYPRGLDVEAFTLNALDQAWHEAVAGADREHVTEFLLRHPERFPEAGVSADGGDFSGHRWTVDTPEDYALVRRIYEHFGHDQFGWREVIELLALHPEWVALNAHVTQKPV